MSAKAKRRASSTRPHDGPDGYVEPGARFEGRDRPGKSHGEPGHAPTMRKREDFRAWISLAAPYLGDPADPSVAGERERKGEEGPFSARPFADRHERALRLPAMLPEKERPRPAFPRRMSSSRG